MRYSDLLLTAFLLLKVEADTAVLESIGTVELEASSTITSQSEEHTYSYNFPGSEYWHFPDKEICQQSESTDFEGSNEYHKDARCHRFMMDYLWINVEVLSLEPLLAVFRGLVDRIHADNFEATFDKTTWKLQTVTNQGKIWLSLGRQANGTFIDHQETQVAEQVFTTVQRALPHVDMSICEPFQVLSYQRGGHFTPHYDYLPYKDDSYWSVNYGNRYATLILILQQAHKGGATIFPLLGISIKPRKGDALFWLNLDSSFQGDERTLHGGCPIIEGEKVIATLWVRQLHQKLLLRSNADGSPNADLLVNPGTHHAPTRFRQDPEISGDYSAYSDYEG